MPYLGNTPSTSFATVVKDTFNGGSTGYTLSKVATTNSVSVFVENVRQEPTTAYAVSGTTLTFTATTPSGTGNIYVLHMNPTTTTTHPAAQNLTAVDGTFTGNIDVDGTANLDVVDIDGAVDMASTLGVTGNVTLGGTLDMNGAELILDADADTSITADTDDQIDIKVAGSDLAHITSTYAKLRGATPLVFGENNSTGTFQSISGEVGANNLLLRSYQSLTFKNGTSGSSLTDGTTAFNIDTNGNVTKPLQPSFHAVSTGSGFGHDSIMVFNTALLNVGSHYNTSTGKFTAPVAGVYFFYHHNIGTGASTVIRVKVYYNDSIFNTYKQIATRQDTSQGNDYAEGHITFCVSLSANDTIKLATFADDSSSGIYNDNSGGQGFNYFGGYLIG